MCVFDSDDELKFILNIEHLREPLQHLEYITYATNTYILHVIVFLRVQRDVQTSRPS